MNRLLLASLLVLAVLTAPAISTAGDQSVALGFEPEEPTVQAGETVEVGVVATSDGGPGGVGIANSTLRLEYPGEHLDVVALEAGPYLEADDATLETDARVNNSAGVAEFDQMLPGTREGVTGTDYFAYVTFEVAGDAPDGDAEIEMGNSRFRFAASDFPISSFGSGTLVLGDGGDTISPTVSEDVPLDSAGDLIVEDGSDGSSEGSDDEDEGDDAAGTDADTADGDDESGPDDGAGSEGDETDARSDEDDNNADGFGNGFEPLPALFALGVIVVITARRGVD